MKTIIAGSRWITDRNVVRHAVNSAVVKANIWPRELVVGRKKLTREEWEENKPKGVDSLAMFYARDIGLDVKPFPADWEAYGKAAGPIRNKAMADYADALIAIWDEESRGTRNMIVAARQRGLKVYVHRYTQVSPSR